MILPCLLALFAAPAGAEDGAPKARHRSGAAILAHMDGDPNDSRWLSVQLDHIHLHKKRGFAYTRTVDRGERGLEWSVQGPVVGQKKAVGLGFELRF